MVDKATREIPNSHSASRRQRVERLERAKERAKARSKETEVPSEVNKVSSSSVTEVPRHADRSGGDVADGDGGDVADGDDELREVSGFIFFIGVVFLVIALFLSTECDTVTDITDVEEMQDFQDCMESMESKLTVMKWMSGLGLIFCLVGIYTKIR